MLGMTRVAALAAVVLGGDVYMGGWATITVENPPRGVQAGSSYQLEFTVRQHGVEPMADLSPTVRFTANGTEQTVRATATSKTGRYVATLAIPSTDSIAVRIDANWHDMRLALMPIAVVPKNGAAPFMTAAQWGRHLFVAKGCGTCHINGDVPEFAARNQSMKVGPDLTGRRLEAAYVRQWLVNPASLPQRDKWNRMPNLGLSAEETNALVELLTGPTRAAMR